MGPCLICFCRGPGSRGRPRTPTGGHPGRTQAAFRL